MSDYKRLTKYNEYSHNAEVYAYTVGKEDVCFDGIDIVVSENSGLAQETIDKLAELEDKIENGTLIELPCKVGDTVYSNERIMFEPVIVKVITTHQSMNLPVSYTVFATAKDGYGIYLSSENFNKDWFLTKAEAEAKLKELKGE